ncbi:MAG: FAD-binding dehydrogenase [Xanthomonadaceae bacterium]|nr:FAD-binding dehydrogenase [Xanthomonadaceae bacterium]
MGDTLSQADVLVVGAGIAGIVTALELAEAGLRVLVIDRDDESALGGQARESFGGMFFVDTPEQRRAGIRDSIELAHADWLAFAQFDADDRWPRAWARAYVEHCTQDVYRWLRGRGVRYFPVPHWVERGLYTPGNSLPRFHMVWGTGRALADNLIAHLRRWVQTRVELRFGLRVERLLHDGGRISGCAGVREHDGMPFELHAPVVVIAAGGINGDLQRVRENWHRDWGNAPTQLLNGSHRFADGRLHDAARAAGAVVTHLDRMWNYAAGVAHPQPRYPDHGLSLVPPRSALWLDWRGQRLGPVPMISGYDTRELVTQVCRSGRDYSWQVLNRTIALRELGVSGAEFNPGFRDRKVLRVLRELLFGSRWLVDTLCRDCPDILVADTLPELVARMNARAGGDAVEVDAVAAAIAAYDAQIARGPRFHNDDQLRRIAHLRQWRGDRLRTCRFQAIADPKAGPLIAIHARILSRKSLGGIRTDLHSRVLSALDQPIPGLYAVGEAAGFGGGGSHGLRALEGGFLGCCVLSARRAAQSISGSGA